jgi:hypothetical protein
MELHNPHHTEILQSIVERMHRAKWITGTNLVTPDDWHINFTELGREQVNKASNALKEIAPSFFKAGVSLDLAELIKRSSAVELSAMLTEIAPIIAELQPPSFSLGEWEAVIGMFLVNARNDGTQESLQRRF